MNVVLMLLVCVSHTESPSVVDPVLQELIERRLAKGPKRTTQALFSARADGAISESNPCVADGTVHVQQTATRERQEVETCE